MYFLQKWNRILILSIYENNYHLIGISKNIMLSTPNIVNIAGAIYSTDYITETFWFWITPQILIEMQMSLAACAPCLLLWHKFI